MDSTRLPFRIGQLYGGVARIDGFVILEPEQLTLEYRMTDTLIGAWKGSITRQSVAFRDLERAEYRLSFFLPRLLLTARTLHAFDQLPSADGSTLKLRIPWKYRLQLRALTSEINLALSYLDADRHRPRLQGI